MPKFKYQSYSNEGDLVEGEIEAIDLKSASDQLQKLDITPFEIKVVGISLLSYEINVFKKKSVLNDLEVAEFTQEIATLLQANIPVDQSFKIMATNPGRKNYNTIAKDILTNLIDGASLSEALMHYSGIFNQEYINIVRVGEKIGKLGPALKDLAEMLERRIEINNRLRSALIYPALLIVMALVSTSVIVSTLIPNIAPIFVENGQPIPDGLQFIIELVDNWQIIITTFVILFSLFIIVRRTAEKRLDWLIYIDKLKIKTPIIGELLAQNTLARFSRTVGSMLKSGVPLIQGLESGYNTVQNKYFKNAFIEMTEQVRSGARLSVTINNIEFVPVMAVQMITIGEETGRLDEMLIRLANIFEKKTQSSIERAMGLITPILTIFIAVIVGGLIVTVMNAVLSINDLAGR